MRRSLVPIAFYVVIAAAIAGEEPSRAKRFRALVAEYQAAKRSYMTAKASAKTTSAKQEAESRRPRPEDYARRFLELANSGPADDAAFDALAWIVTYSPRGPEAGECMEILASRYVEHKRLGSVLQNLGTIRSQASEKLLRAALERSPDRSIRAQACYALATLLTAQDGTVPAKTGTKKRNIKSDSSNEPSDDSARDEAVKLFERLAGDYADVKVAGRKTYGDLAKAGLARLNRPSGRMATSAAGAAHAESGPTGLEVGMVAPPIEGTDTDSQAMRLIEYRGKVVVLDFWGHW